MGLSFAYLIFGSGFAHIGIFPFFPAECALCACIISNYGGCVSRYISMLRRGEALAIAVQLFIAYGMVEAARGMIGTNSYRSSMEGLASHYYALFIFVGIAVGRKLESREVRVWVTWGALIAGFYYIVYATVLSRTRLGQASPGVTPLLTIGGIPPLLAVALEAMAPVAGSLYGPAFALNVVGLLANPGRGSWTGFIAGLWVAKRGRWRLKKVAQAAIALAAIGAAVGTGSWMKVAAGRGGAVSARSAIARFVSTFDVGAAEKIGGNTGADSVESTNGTVKWRAQLWRTCIQRLNRRPIDWIAGLGYGVTVGQISGYGSDLRTPHNVIILYTVYGGIIGLLLFCSVMLCLYTHPAFCQASIGRRMFRSLFLCCITMALVGELFETPYGAVPFYFMSGLIIGQIENARTESLCGVCASRRVRSMSSAGSMDASRVYGGGGM